MQISIKALAIYSTLSPTLAHLNYVGVQVEAIQTQVCVHVCFERVNVCAHAVTLLARVSADRGLLPNRSRPH